MSFLPVQKMWERFDISLRDSDVSAFFDLMCLGELTIKSTVLGLVAALQTDKDRHQYRLLHRLVRADGLGEWDQVLQELLTGSAAHLLKAAATAEQKELTMRIAPESWQYEAVSGLHKCLRILNPKEEKLPDKIDGRRWFSMFAQLRNATRGHGAQAGSVLGKLTPPLRRSLQLFTGNFSLFMRPWAYLHRSLSCRFRFTPLGKHVETFEQLDLSDTSHPDGIYWYADELIFVPLLQSAPEAFDFFYPNGGFRETTFELISYVTGNTIEGDATPYTAPPSQLPSSETQGLGILETYGKAFTNLPIRRNPYIRRTELERELGETLRFHERHEMVTLFGRGGIGKTSLALAVLHSLAEEGEYHTIVWFSARDIDLLPDKPLPVAPSVLTQQDVAKEFCRLTEPQDRLTKGFRPAEFLEQCLRKPLLGPTLFVFDNFETMQHPFDVFRWLDVNIRSPNKVLITTRHHEFKGDYVMGHDLPPLHSHDILQCVRHIPHWRCKADTTPGAGAAGIGYFGV